MAIVYITKYALTTGMFSIKTDDVEKVINKQSPNGHQLYFYNDWHVIEEDAIARVKIMKNKKIKALRKQIKKLQLM